MAQQVLTQFEEHPDSWSRVPDILERSSYPQSKVFCSVSSIVLWLKGLVVHWNSNPGEAHPDEMEGAAGWAATR